MFRTASLISRCNASLRTTLSPNLRRRSVTTSKVIITLGAASSVISMDEPGNLGSIRLDAAPPTRKPKVVLPVVPRADLGTSKSNRIRSSLLDGGISGSRAWKAPAARLNLVERSGLVIGLASTKDSTTATHSKRSKSASTSQSSQGTSKKQTAEKKPTLPKYSFNDFSPAATTVYTRNEEEADDLVQGLKGPLGFDIEWRVIFRPNVPERRTALVQLSTERLILLIQVSAMKRFPKRLQEIIESKKVIKLGANILNDGNKLFKDFGILANNLVELGAVAQQADPDFVKAFGSNRSIVSLAKVVENYCGKKLVKGKERTGNWEAELLPNMIAYAANDAHCALMVYKRLLDLAVIHERTLTPADYTSVVTIPGPTATASTTSTSITEPPSSAANPANMPMRPQHARAYQYWHRDNLPLERICAKLRSEEDPLKESTVISYVIGALQSDPSLPFDMVRLKALVQMEAGSWRRHRDWILEVDREATSEVGKQ